MLAVLFENDQHSREVLSSMLRDFGFSTVHATSRLEEFIYFLQHEDKQVDLILSSQNLKTERDFSLADFTAKLSHLDRCPLVAISDHWLDRPFSPFKRRLSRVDSILWRPLQRKALQLGIANAFEHRASLRSTILFYGSEASAALIEESVLSDREMQWKTIVDFQDPKAFSQFLDKNPGEVGGILIEPDGKESVLAKDVQRFKRSRAGIGAQFGVYSRDPEVLNPFVKLLDISFAPETPWVEALESLSKRCIFSWRMNHQIQLIREAIKKNDLKSALKLVKKGLEWDPARWELLELKGFLSSDAASLWSALQAQPCSPYAYLSLLKFVVGEEREKVLKQSRLYCPRHPQLMEIRT